MNKYSNNLHIRIFMHIIADFMPSEVKNMHEF